MAMTEPSPNIVYVEVQQHKTNHILHLLLSIVTAGLWIPVWIIIAAVNSNRANPVTFTGSTKDLVVRAAIALGVIILIFLIVGIASLITA